ncbi:unnamed protein product [Urochloa humidicola]
MPGRDRRRGTWWDLKRNCIAIEGQDFAQDTQEGGADEFVLIPDSDEERGAKGSSLLGDDDEYVPETEPQDFATASGVVGSCANQSRRRLGTMLHDWLRLIADVKEEPNNVKLEEPDSVMLEKEEPNSVKLEDEEPNNVKLEKEELDNVKMEKEEPDNVKMEKEEPDNVKLEKEELDHMVSFSDMETDDEGCLFQDGVDLRGHSQVEDDDFNEQSDNSSSSNMMLTSSVYTPRSCMTSSKVMGAH